MKKILILLSIVLVTLSSCNVDSESRQFAGTYKGTYTFISENRTKDGSVFIASNPLNENGILVFGVLPLDCIGSGIYESRSEDAAMIGDILSRIGVTSSASSTVEENIKNMNVKATFTNGSIELVVSYEVELVSSLGISTEIRIIEFNGKK